MYKRIFTIILCIALCFSALNFVGCKKDNSFTVTFTSGHEDAYCYYGKEVQRVTSSNQIIEPIYIREGYNFVGWNVSISRITSATTVVAQWKRYEMHVVFNGNGGQTDDGKTTVSMTVDSAYELIENQPQFKKKGYSLSWEPSLGKITESCSVNAVWTINEYNVIFKDKLGGDFSGNSLNITYKRKLDYSHIQAPEVLGEKFVYWMDSDGLAIDNGIVWDIDADKTLKAVYTAQEDYVISYDLNGGDRQISQTTRSFNQNTDINIITPTKKGYSFDGWQINGGSQTYFSNEITLEHFKVDGELIDINLKATWSTVPYTATIDADGGEFVGESQIDFLYGYEIGALPTPQKQNYEFAGWFYGDYQIKEGDTWEFAENITITARYRAIYKVKFSLTGKANTYNEQVVCELVKWGDIPNAQTLEDVEIEIVEGQSLLSKDIGIMPVVKPIEQKGLEEYKFGNYWKYIDSNTSYKILANTIFNSENLPNICAGDTIVLVPHIKLVWSPNY